VLFISGESGAATIRNAARRICQAKDIRLQDLDIYWVFKLPQLANAEHLAVVEQTIIELSPKVAFFDPCYLMLLSGGSADNAKNIYAMGPHLGAISALCIENGCTPVLLHHFKRSREAYAEPELDDLAFSGMAEFARQWILIDRRGPFDPDNADGLHELWLHCGGSAGHSLARAVDIKEGKLRHDFSGRRWEVSIQSPSALRTAQKEAKRREKDEQQQEKDRVDELKLMAAIDAGNGEPVSKTTAKNASGLRTERLEPAIIRCRAQGILETGIPVQVPCGKKGFRTVKDGLRRAS
jgi:replicative DNA helicase